MAMRDSAAGNRRLISITLGRGVQNEYEMLLAIVRETNDILTKLEKRRLQDARDANIGMWLKKVKELYYEADEVLDELSFEDMRLRQMGIQKDMIRKVSNSFSPSNPLLFRLRMSRKIKDFRHMLDEVKEGMQFLDSTVAENRERETNDLRRVPVVVTSTSGDVYGRDEDKNKIINMLIDTNNEEMLPVIPIVGMGGIGKTTLAQLIYNDESIKSHFDLTCWVCVSFDFDVKVILKKIIEGCAGSTPGETTLDNLWHMLEEILSGKKFLLVLDDVWEEDSQKWDNLRTSLRSIGSAESKIIVTTRSKRVASIMGTGYSHNLGPLSKEDSWKLFSRRVFGRGGAPENDLLSCTGKAIVAKCGGLPLALVVVASTLRSKARIIYEWEKVLNSLNEGNDESSEVEPFRTLGISYDSLESPWKRCFAYCTLFPADDIIEKKELIQLWMAEGFLEGQASSSLSNNGDVNLEDIGNEYLTSLERRSFLQFVGRDDKGEPLKYCHMHDLLRELALKMTVLGNEVMTVANVDELKSIPNPPPRYLSLSDSGNTQSAVSDEFYVKMKKVRTCLIGCRNDISAARLFSNFRSLRVLKLRHVSDDHLPPSIGELIHLRYLDLSHGRFKALPASISKLLHLQTLKLLRCRYLQSLPKGMEKLVNLRHLEIERNLDIPRGVLKQLRSLRTFTSFKVGNNVTQAGIEELGSLKQLEGRLSLIGLNNVKKAAAAAAANLNEKEKLQELALEWESDWHVCTDDRESRKQDVVLEELQPYPNLQFLRILRFSGTKFPEWLSGSSRYNILELEICSCHHVQSLDIKGLSHLRKLIISYCENLEYARVEGLQFLELLEFKGCDKLKSLPTEVAEQVGSSQDIPSILPGLVNLRIESCDNLPILPEEEMLLLKSLKTLHLGNNAKQMDWTKMQGLENLSLLQHLRIENYSNLEALPEGIGKLESLRGFAIRECPKLDFLPKEMQHWRSLQTLSIFACANLRDLPRGIAKLESLEELEINGCDCFISFPDELQELKSLKKLKIERCSNLRSLPDFGNLSSLEVLEISRCKRLTSLPGGMRRLESLDTLKIHECDNLKELGDELGHPSTLRVLDIIGCPNLKSLPEGLGNLQNLRLLEITDCSNLEVLPEGLGNLSSLRRLYIKKCINLRSFPENARQMTSLGVLWLIECPKLDFSGGLRYLTALEKLAIWGCHNLVELSPVGEGFQDLKSLEELTISHCSKLGSLPGGLENLTSLKELVIWNCVELKIDAPVIQKLKASGKLSIKGCTSLDPLLETVDDDDES